MTATDPASETRAYLTDILDDLDDYVGAAQQAARKGQSPRDILMALSDLHDQIGLAIGQAVDLL